MKYLNYLVMAIFAICVTSCGNGGSITPTSKKVNGPLGKYYEIVERDYKIIDDKLSVEFKRIAEGGPKDASWDTHPTFIVELQDEDGNVLSSKSTDVVDTEDQLEAVFSLGVDETSSIQFRFDKTEGAVKFKVSSKWDGEEIKYNSSSTEVYNDEDEEDDDDENGYSASDMMDEAYDEADRMMDEAYDEANRMMDEAYDEADRMMDEAYKGVPGVINKAVTKDMRQAQKDAAAEMRQAQKEAAEEMRQAQKDAAEEMRRAMGL